MGQRPTEVETDAENRHGAGYEERIGYRPHTSLSRRFVMSHQRTRLSEQTQAGPQLQHGQDGRFHGESRNRQYTMRATVSP